MAFEGELPTSEERSESKATPNGACHRVYAIWNNFVGESNGVVSLGPWGGVPLVTSPWLLTLILWFTNHVRTDFIARDTVLEVALGLM